MLFLHKSRVFLRRNLARTVEQEFPLLDLQQYYLPDPHGPLENVTPKMRLRKLPGYPPKILYASARIRSLRLDELLQRLRYRVPPGKSI